jgi:hypothetical protein
MWSNYKSNFTFKFLIAVAPSGLITFLSQAYGGRATDSFITVDSGFFNLLGPDDVVLADKGFPQIVHDGAEKGAFVIMPPFKRGGKQFTNSENEAGYKCAIGRMKTFKILNSIDHSLYPYIDDILLCVAFLCNNMSDLIKEN